MINFSFNYLIYKGLYFFYQFNPVIDKIEFIINSLSFLKIPQFSIWSSFADRFS